MNMELRPYQRECLEAIERQKPGSYLVQMATGLGKTVTFSSINRRGRMLILSHREELVRQPLRYFDCKTGIEMAGLHASPEDEVVSASVMSLVRRTGRFAPDAFDVIVTDEAHHAAAGSYRALYRYFKPRLHLGFTATPNRSDNVRLDDIFEDIIFERDLQWGIRNGYLSDIFCRRVDIGYDLSAVRSRAGDFAAGELEQAMGGTADVIAKVYREMATGATLIFAVSVMEAEAIARRIPGAVAVTGETKNRAEIVAAFTGGRIPCIVSVMVFTEGTDIPRVETVILARPTQSDTLYAQMAGRGLRLYPGKEKLNLIDCVGVTGRASLCTAPSLLGLDLQNVPEERLGTLEGSLFDLPGKVLRASDCPQSWIRNIEIVDLWAREQSYNLRGINFFRMPDGSLECNLPGKRLRIPCQDELGRVVMNGRQMPVQEAIDEAYRLLRDRYAQHEYIWNVNRARGWGQQPASAKQLDLIRRCCQGYDPRGLTKLQASQILHRVTGSRTQTLGAAQTRQLFEKS